MSIHQLKSAKVRWISIDAIDDEAMEFLRANFKFHSLDLEDVKSDAHHPKLDIYPNYVFAVLHIPQIDSDKRKFSADEINIFIGKDYVVTITRNPIEVIDLFFSRLTRNSRLKKDILEKGPGFLSYKILSHAFRGTYATAGQLGKDVNDVEEAIFKTGGSASVRLLATTRRNILGMRRILEPQRLIIASLGQVRKTFLPETLAPYLDDIKDQLDKAHALLDSYKDTIDGLNETNESLLSFRMNEIIKMLTIFSVSMMPINLVTGFYGMNIVGLPFSENRFFVWGLGMLFTFGVFVILWLLHKKRWY